MTSRRAAALVDAGVFLQLAGDAAGARDLFRQALLLDPGNDKAQRLLAAMPEPEPAAAITLPPPRTKARHHHTVPPSHPSAPRRIASASQPATSAPRPAVSAPQPVISAPRPAVSAPRPVTSAPRPAVSAPQPATSAPRPAMYAAQPAASAPTEPRPAASAPPSMRRRAPPRSTPPSPAATETFAPSPRGSTDVERDLEEVDVFMRYGMYDKALDYVMRVLRRDAECLAAHEKAWEVLRAAGHHPLAVEQLLNVVQMLVDRKAPVRARRYLEVLAAERPGHPALKRYRALLEAPKAEARAADATIIDPDFPAPWRPKR